MKYKRLKDLLKEADHIEIRNDGNPEIKALRQDSRQLEEGDAFIAIRGNAADGHSYLNTAARQKAAAIFCEVWPEHFETDIVYIRCMDTRQTLAQLAAAYYDHPSREVCLVGVTGTNGKTTVASLLYQLFRMLGHESGLISTIDIRIGDRTEAARLTTPDVLSVNALLREMMQAGCSHVFMEVSSHAVDQKRIAGLDFAVGVFTNITHDHLDYHGSFKNYIRAKAGFFEALGPGALALINVDDRNGAVMVEKCRARVLRYSLNSLVDFKAKLLSSDVFGLSLNFNGVEFHSPMIGAFNVYNLLAVYGVAASLMDENRKFEIMEKMSLLRPAKGRMEIVNNRPLVIVDYAHTPDALMNVLKTVKESGVRGKLICVSGCGGDRDRTKRAVMGKIAVEYSDTAIFTSDNPRSEDPEEIVKEMKRDLNREELKGVLEIIDRNIAIRTACRMAGNEDVVVITGKGHEEYQEIAGVRRFFSDQLIVKEVFSENI